MCVVNFTFYKSNSVISVKEVKHLPNSIGGIKVSGYVAKVGNGRFPSPDFCPMNLHFFFFPNGFKLEA